MAVGITRKIYLEMEKPSQQDSRSDQTRILDALAQRGVKARLNINTLRKLYPLVTDAEWKITASLAYNGITWECVDIEAGNTEREHYGLAVDLGSTSVVCRLVDCFSRACLAEVSAYNQQIRFGEDILTRIFYSKDEPGKLEEIRKATVDTILTLMDELARKTGKDMRKCISMTISGNTTMIHFFVGMDAFCVFHEPYAVRADDPGFLRACDAGIPIPGYVYCFPAKANYLGGDIISGVAAKGLQDREKICVFFDVGTNGELVVGNKDFLLCGAGAAGPALEGGVVRTGMRAAAGAVEEVRLQDGQFQLKVIGNTEPKGICGSGIIDLLSELFLHGWLNIQGKLQKEKSDRIAFRMNEDSGQEELAVCYAPGLWFYQNDIDEFIRTKAAAATMMEYMLQETGITVNDVEYFYMSGSFGTHVNKESAVNIGMYPDVERSRIIPAGNTSLEGAQKLLLDLSVLKDIERILGLMTYVQFGAVDNFLDMMNAATALPHTDLDRYPSVLIKLQDNGIIL